MRAQSLEISIFTDPRVLLCVLKCEDCFKKMNMMELQAVVKLGKILPASLNVHRLSRQLCLFHILSCRALTIQRGGETERSF